VLLARNNKKISEQKITDLYQQLASLLNAGIALITALELSMESYRDKTMRRLIINIKTHIENGKTLSESLAYYPQYFDLFSRHLIYAGEQIGNISSTLEKIIEHRKTIAMIKNKIKKALFYPATVLCIACAIIFILLFYVIPELQGLFLDFGKQLPAYTRFIMAISTQLHQNIFLILIFLLFFTLIFYFIKTKVPMKIKLPLLSSVIEKYITAHWTYTLATTLNAGIPLAQALYIVSHTLHNFHYQKALRQIKEKIMQGQSMHIAMEHTALFPLRVKQMIYIGEQSGTLPIVLTQLSIFYQTEANDQTEILLNLLEPILIIILGIIIGSIVIAMYLPIFKLGSII